MAFDQAALDEARSSGYSDDEIYSHLAGTDPKFAEAQQNGYKLDDVAAHLAPTMAPQVVTPETTPEQPSFIDRPLGGAAPRIPQQTNPILGTIAGLVNTAIGAGEALTTPKNIALGAATAAAPEIVKPLAGAGFATSAFSDIPGAVREAFQPGTTFQRGVELGGRALTDVAFGLLGMKFGGTPTAPKPATPTLTDTLFPKAPEPAEAALTQVEQQAPVEAAKNLQDVQQLATTTSPDLGLPKEIAAETKPTEPQLPQQEPKTYNIRGEDISTGDQVKWMSGGTWDGVIQGAKENPSGTHDVEVKATNGETFVLKDAEHYGISKGASEHITGANKPDYPGWEKDYPQLTTKGQPNAIEPSNAQVEGGQAPLGVQEGTTGQIPSPGSSDNALREAQGGAARGQVPGAEAVSSEQSTPAVGKDISLPDVPKPEGGNIGLTKDYISQDREARGEEPLAAQARKSNPETWDNAARTFQANPNAGHELVASIINNPERGVSEDDMGVLLRHKVDLSNQTDFNYERLKSPDTTPEEKGAALTQMAALRDARNNADLAVDTVGTRAGRSLQFLQKMSTDDYSLSSMLQDRSAAMGGQIDPAKLDKITDQTSEYSKDILAKDKAWQDYLKTNKQQESALAAYKTRLKTATTDYERRAAFQEFEPKIRSQMELDPEAVQLKADLADAKNKWQSQLLKDQIANQPMWQKVLGGTAWLARESALSGYHTLAKLAGFTAGKLVEIPLNQTAQRVWSMIPGFDKLAARSELGPGANAQELGKLYSGFFTTGAKQAGTKLANLAKGKGTDFSADYEGNKIGLQYPSFFGNIHGIEKTLIRTGIESMTREQAINQTMRKLAAEGVTKGDDISDPVVQAGINKLSFDAGTNDILLGNNYAADWVNRGLSGLEKNQPSTGKPSAPLVLMSTLIRSLITKGIVRTPANFVKHIFERTPAGLALGVGRGLTAIAKGVENTPPAHATAINRLLGVGSVGSAMFLWGALDALRDPQNRIFGGYYQPGEKRDPSDVKWGTLRVEGYTAPHYAVHNLMTEPAQMGNTMMRVARSALSKKDATNKGLIQGAIASTLGLAEQAPVVNPALKLGKITDPRTQAGYFGQLVQGLIPQLVQNVAADLDKSEAGRAPKTVLENVKMGIPGLRETVPEKGTTTRQKKSPFTFTP